MKDHQTVEPNAKYTCTTKRFYVTGILKPNGTESGQNSNRTEQNPNLDPDRTETELLLVGSIPITSARCLHDARDPVVAGSDNRIAERWAGLVLVTYNVHATAAAAPACTFSSVCVRC